MQRVTSRIGDIVIEARDPENLGRFWCAALGYRITGSDETGVAISGARNAPTMLFLRTDDDLPGAGTLHFDLCPTNGGQMDELERLLSLGGNADRRGPVGLLARARGPRRQQVLSHGQTHRTGAR